MMMMMMMNHYHISHMSGSHKRPPTSPEEEHPRERERERERDLTASISSERMEEEVEEMVEPAVAVDEEEEAEVGVQWRGWRGEAPWPRKSGGVMLEGYVDGADSGGDQGPGGVLRTKSLTDEDLKELKGCLDLGFGFSYEEIPDLCNTLPALELCYSMTQRFLDDHHHHHHHHQRSFDRSSSGESVDLCASPTSPPIANWRISSPGDHPDEVKARLRYWAQAVACTIRLCS